MAKGQSPTARTLAELRRLGYRAAVVERWCSHSKQRKDLFTWMDILAYHPEGGIVGVQATSASNLAARVTKILEVDQDGTVSDWLQSGARCEVWGWRKRAKPENRKWWHANRREILIVGGELKVIEL